MPSQHSLDLDRETMRALAYRISDLVVSHLSNLREQPVLASAPRRHLRESLQSPAPRSGENLDDLIATLERNVFPYHAREPHPRFLAYVPSCPTFPAVLGDWIASGFNFFAGVWAVAAGPNQIEMTVLDWFRDWMQLPETATGLLTSGGSAANLTALVAARHRAMPADGDIRKLTAYTSSQAHSSLLRAAWIAGIPRQNIRIVPADKSLRIEPQSLASAIAADTAAGMRPFAVLASAGTTNTGAVDPLNDIADVCETHRLWFHVDAAYGGFAMLSERARRLLQGVERADSVTLDPHKWLFVPFECGCLMVRDASALTDAFRIYPEYLKDVEPGDEEVNFADRGEQLTRYSRALKVWMCVSYFGTDAIAAAIDSTMDLATFAQELIEAAPELEVLSPAQFGIVCFRAKPTGSESPSELDALNERINTAVNASGEFLISSTRLHGRYSLRICCLSYRTTQADIRALVRAVRDAARTSRGSGTSRHHDAKGFD